MSNINTNLSEINRQNILLRSVIATREFSNQTKRSTISDPRLNRERDPIKLNSELYAHFAKEMNIINFKHSEIQHIFFSYSKLLKSKKPQLVERDIKDMIKAMRLEKGKSQKEKVDFFATPTQNFVSPF